MEDPVNEIRGVVKGLVASKNPSEQKFCVQKYYAPDASLDHTLCTVTSGPNSRDNGILPIYQWLRVMSQSDIEVYHVGKCQTSRSNRALKSSKGCIPKLNFCARVAWREQVSTNRRTSCTSDPLLHICVSC